MDTSKEHGPAASGTSGSHDKAASRPPSSPAERVERVFAHFRPRPAIPSVAVFWLMSIMPLFLLGPQLGNGAIDAGFWALWLIPLGIVLSVGLAVGAGFCSFFPQFAWCALATWALSLAERGGFPDWHRYLLFAGIGICIAMVGVQFYRVRTGAFVPTLPSDEPDSD